MSTIVQGLELPIGQVVVGDEADNIIGKVPLWFDPSCTCREGQPRGVAVHHSPQDGLAAAHHRVGVAGPLVPLTLCSLSAAVSRTE